MLINTCTRTSVDRFGRKHTAHIANLRCNQCNAEFVRSAIPTITTKTVHACSRACKHLLLKTGGALDALKRKTCIRRYGTESPMSTERSGAKQKREATCIARFGTSVPTRTDAIKQKTAATCIDRYGVMHPMSSPAIKVKMVHSLRTNNDLVAIAAKRLETMKKNHSFQKSRVEEHFYKMLLMKFAVDDIERNKRLADTPWPIDFYIKSLDLWIQIDGVYWHGLDGKLHERQSSTSKRDKVIAYKWNVDRRQEMFFADHKLRLLRITDVTLAKLTSLPDDIATIAYFNSERCADV